MEEQVTIKLTKAEANYLWLLTAMDAMRIDAMTTHKERDYHYEIRHSLREKLFKLENEEDNNEQAISIHTDLGEAG